LLTKYEIKKIVSGESPYKRNTLDAREVKHRSLSVKEMVELTREKKKN